MVPLSSLKEEERWSFLALYISVVVGLFVNCFYLFTFSLAWAPSKPYMHLLFLTFLSLLACI